MRDASSSGSKATVHRDATAIETNAWQGYYSLPMPSRKKSEGHHQFKVGDPVSVTLHTGQIVYGTVRAVVLHTDGVKLQVDYGNDETALVELWRVRAK
jgi:hypothetical protein